MKNECLFKHENCLIIGGNGFLGVNLIIKLLEIGCKVRVFDLNNSNIPIEILKNIEFIKGDLINRKEIASALVSIDKVFYFAYSTNVISSIENVFNDQLNVIFALNTLEEIIHSNVNKIIFASSGGTVYGEPKYLPIDEDHLLNPISPYGISKVAIEKYLYYYFHQHKINYSICRLSNPYGKYQNPKGAVGAVSVFLYKAYFNETIIIFGDSKSIIRDYIYIDDLIDGLILVAFSKNKEKIYNIGSGKDVSLMDIINIIQEIKGIKVKIEFKPAKLENISRVVLDCKRLNNEYDWEPKTEIKEGIKNTFEWIKNSFNKIS